MKFLRYCTGESIMTAGKISDTPHNFWKFPYTPGVPPPISLPASSITVHASGAKTSYHRRKVSTIISRSACSQGKQPQGTVWVERGASLPAYILLTSTPCTTSWWKFCSNLCLVGVDDRTTSAYYSVIVTFYRDSARAMWSHRNNSD